MAGPKVSVVIPVYGTEAHLGECLDSVLGQTLGDIEVICVNDCSPDNAQAILDDYAARDGRIRVIAHAQNRGPSAARNTGVGVARGKYVRFVDSDDLLPEDALERMHAVAVENDADMVRAGGTTLRQGKLVDSRHHLSYDRDVPLTTLDACPLLWPLVGTVFCLFKRTFLLKHSLAYLEGVFQHEDYIFLSEALAKAKRISLLARSCYIYRIVEKDPVAYEGAMEMAHAIGLVRRNWARHGEAYRFWINYMRQPYAELLLLAANRYPRAEAVDVVRSFRDIYRNIPIPDAIMKVWAVCTEERIIKDTYRLLATVSPEEFVRRVRDKAIPGGAAAAPFRAANSPGVRFARRLNAVYGSRSWRCTRLLRWMADRLGGQ